MAALRVVAVEFLRHLAASASMRTAFVTFSTVAPVAPGNVFSHLVLDAEPTLDIGALHTQSVCSAR